MEDIKKARLDALTADETKLAKVLLHNKKMTDEQLDTFIGVREKQDREGKKYLGETLVERGLITQETLDEFFGQNNKMYLEFCEQMHEKGFIKTSQFKAIMDDEASQKNVVTVIENLGVMTKDSFIKLFSGSYNTFKLGEWLVAKHKVDAAELNEALKEQSLHSLDDYLVYYKIVDSKIIDVVKSKLRMES